MLKAQVDLNRLLPLQVPAPQDLRDQLNQLRNDPALQYLVQRLQRRLLELHLSRQSSSNSADQSLFDAGVIAGCGKMLDQIDIVFNEAATRNQSSNLGIGEDIEQ